MPVSQKKPVTGVKRNLEMELQELKRLSRNWKLKTLINKFEKAVREEAFAGTYLYNDEAEEIRDNYKKIKKKLMSYL